MIARIGTRRGRKASLEDDVRLSARTGLSYVQSTREHVAQLQRVAGILDLAAEVDPVNGPAASVRAAELRSEAALELGTFTDSAADQHTDSTARPVFRVLEDVDQL